jgi:protein ImuB
MNFDPLVVPSINNSLSSGVKKNKGINCPQLIESSEDLWVYLYFPYFSIEVLTGNVVDKQPCVSVTKVKKIIKVEAANPQAQVLGIKSGMSLQSFYMNERVKILKRNQEVEYFVLESLCEWALKFTPRISKVGYQGLLLEVKGSLKLFGGIKSLMKQMVTELKSLGYKAEFAVTPIPSAAVILCKDKSNLVVVDKTNLKKILSITSVTALFISHQEKKNLKDLGIRNLGDCRRLPRIGLRERLSSDFVDMLDRLFGDKPEYVEEFTPREFFESTFHFRSEVTEIKSLVCAAQDLLRELSFYLSRRQSRPSRLIWQLEGSDNYRDFLSICCDDSLSRESLIKSLVSYISEQTLAGRYLSSLGIKVLDVPKDLDTRIDFFSSKYKGEKILDCKNLILSLRGRLGEGAVFFLKEDFSSEPEDSYYRKSISNHLLSLSSTYYPERPLWLVKKPVKLSATNRWPEYQGVLVIKSERERIVTNWWERNIIARDYFIASTASGRRIWIYKELGVLNSWYLRGIFD